jgi:ribonuclease HI
MNQLPMITIYTDGGCRPNPGPGGWGAVLLIKGKKPKDLSGGERESTNNRMELTAAIEALRFLTTGHQVKLVTDSKYLRQGVTQWMENWRRNGWRTAQKTAVKNQDLWQALSEEMERHEIDWHWTRGHAGNKWNERADRLASREIEREELPVDDPGAVHLYAAAAYSGKQRAGAWGVVLAFQEKVKESSEKVGGASANQMHLQAAIEGLQSLKRPVRVHLYTASDYLKDGATRWVKGWRARNWQTRDGKDVSHRPLWERLSELLEPHDVRWHVVDKNHSPELMDQAKEAARQILN